MPENQTLPQKMCELNKQIIRTTLSNMLTVAGVVGRSIGRTADASRTAGKTVAGQTRAAAEQTGDTMVAGVKSVAGEVRDAAAATSSSVSTGAKTVAGQAKAQGSRVAKVADRQANHVVDETSRVVADRPAPGTPYEEWTKKQLMDRARDLDVDGRATMNKAELVDALRS